MNCGGLRAGPLIADGWRDEMCHRPRGHLIGSRRRHTADGNGSGCTSGDRRRVSARQLGGCRPKHLRWCIHKMCYEKHWNLPTFVTMPNFTLTKVRTPSSSAVARTSFSSTVPAELQHLVFNEIHSCAVDLESDPSERLSSIRPTAMHPSIFGKSIHLKYADATHIKHIFVRAPARVAERGYI